MARLMDAMTPDAVTRGGPRMFPLMNITQDADNIYVRAELPGIKPSDIDVSVIDNKISISGTRELPAEKEGVSYHRRERQGGTFSRSVELPCPFDRDRVDAKFENGLLTVTLPLAEETKPRQITVKAG